MSEPNPMIESADLLALTADIVSAHVSNNMVSTTDLPSLIQSVHSALTATASPSAPEAPKAEPAVPIRSSIKRDFIVCLEDGAKLKMLKRYLRTRYGMSPEEYRAKWNLPRDYPMVAPAYAERRRGLAKSIGLGRRKAADVAASAEKAVKGATKSISDGLAAAREHLGGDAKPAPKPRARKADKAGA